MANAVDGATEEKQDLVDQFDVKLDVIFQTPRYKGINILQSVKKLAQ